MTKKKVQIEDVVVSKISVEELANEARIAAEEEEVLLKNAFSRAVTMAAGESHPDQKVSVIRAILEKDFRIVRK